MTNKTISGEWYSCGKLSEEKISCNDTKQYELVTDKNVKTKLAIELIKFFNENPHVKFLQDQSDLITETLPVLTKGFEDTYIHFKDKSSQAIRSETDYKKAMENPRDYFLSGKDDEFTTLIFNDVNDEELRESIKRLREQYIKKEFDINGSVLWRTADSSAYTHVNEERKAFFEPDIEAKTEKSVAESTKASVVKDMGITNDKNFGSLIPPKVKK
ncbi:MAG: hypothetical protein GY909_09290 [Oligoflexia bacterium]|nr:hypothetical protein [Oligoflexia bacterium]